MVVLEGIQVGGTAWASFLMRGSKDREMRVEATAVGEVSETGS